MLKMLTEHPHQHTTLVGVTSTSSSSAMYSTAISRLSSKGGTSFNASSFPIVVVVIDDDGY